MTYEEYLDKVKELTEEYLARGGKFRLGPGETVDPELAQWYRDEHLRLAKECGRKEGAR